MTNPAPVETLRAFLDRRERELTAQINGLRTQLEPREQELAEIRRIRSSLTLSPSNTSRIVEALIGPRPTFFAGGGDATPALPTSKLQLSEDALKALGGYSAPGEFASIEVEIGEPDTPAVKDSPTIKDLIVRALFETRGAGLSPDGLLQYINRIYGRPVERTSLHPQISRLRHDGMIKQKPEGNWRLTISGQKYADMIYGEPTKK